MASREILLKGASLAALILVAAATRARAQLVALNTPNPTQSQVGSPTLPDQTDASAGGQFTSSVQLDYSTGKYGETQRTDITTLNLIEDYVYKAWTVDLTVPPYERISGPGNVLPVIGRVNGEDEVVGTTQTTETNSGFGDVDLSVGNDIYRNDAGWDVLLTGEVKFGTASATKDLGTGRTDYSPSVDISKEMGDFTPWVSVGYRFLGKAPGLGLRDYVYGSVGTSYAVTDKTTLSVAFDTSARSTDTTNVDNDTSLEIKRKLNSSWSVDLLAIAGLSTAAPQAEAMGTVAYKF